MDQQDQMVSYARSIRSDDKSGRLIYQEGAAHLSLGCSSPRHVSMCEQHLLFVEPMGLEVCMNMHVDY
jgi:hypothetical protein